MAEFAPIAPLALMEAMDETSPEILGNYHLLLAHIILEDPEGWYTYYSRRRAAGIKTHVTLDNSLVECGAPLSGRELLRAADIVGATCIVLPDALGDPVATVKASLQGAMDIGDPPEDTKFLVVVQGTMPSESRLCAEKILNELGDSVGYLSVPRVTADRTGSRRKHVELLRGEFRLPIHLLGFSDHLLDDIMCTRLEGVIGIDSAMPVWHGGLGGVLPRVLRSGKFDLGKRPQDFWSWEFTTPEMLLNLERIRIWMGAT